MDTVSGPLINIIPAVSVNGKGGRTGKTRGFQRRTVGSSVGARRCPIHQLIFSLPLYELLFYRVLRKTEKNVQEEDVQLECFEQRKAPDRIFALGLRGNRSDIKPFQRRHSKGSGVTESRGEEFGK